MLNQQPPFNIQDSFFSALNCVQIKMYNANSSKAYRQIIVGTQRYVVVDTGESVCVQITNNTNGMLAFPVFVEGANIYWGKANTPQACQEADMWEVTPHGSINITGFYNPDTRKLRPFIVTKSSNGVANSMFGANVAEEVAGRYSIWMKDPVPGQHLYSYGADSLQKGINTGSASRDVTRGGNAAAIGLGAAQAHGHRDTNVVYQKNATKLVDIRAITLTQLSELLGIRLGRGFNRFVDLDNRQGDWGQIPTSGNQPFRG